MALLPRLPHAPGQVQLRPRRDQRVPVQVGGQVLRAAGFPEHEFWYSQRRRYGSPRSKTGLGPLQYSRKGSSTVPRDGPRRPFRSVTTITRRPGRAWYWVRTAAGDRSAAAGPPVRAGTGPPRPGSAAGRCR